MRKRKKSKYSLSANSYLLLHLANIAWGVFKGQKSVEEGIGKFPARVLQTLPESFRIYPRIVPSGSEIEGFNWKVFLQSLLEMRILIINQILSLGAPLKLKGQHTIDWKHVQILRMLYGKGRKEYDLGSLFGQHIEKRLDSIPFTLSDDFRLRPRWDYSDPGQTLWGMFAQCVIEIKEMGFDRLMWCHFSEGRDNFCLNLLWDESKNKGKIYCNEDDCRKARLRARVSAFRKKKAH